MFSFILSIVYFLIRNTVNALKIAAVAIAPSFLFHSILFITTHNQLNNPLQLIHFITTPAFIPEWIFFNILSLTITLKNINAKLTAFVSSCGLLVIVYALISYLLPTPTVLYTHLIFHDTTTVNYNPYNTTDTKQLIATAYNHPSAYNAKFNPHPLVNQVYSYSLPVSMNIKYSLGKYQSTVHNHTVTIQDRFRFDNLWDSYQLSIFSYALQPFVTGQSITINFSISIP